MNPNVVLNVMRVTKKTNAEFLHADPRQQIAKARSVNKGKLTSSLEIQAISKKCIDVLEKPEKTAADFTEFIRLREIEVQKMLRDEFALPITTAKREETDVES